MGHHDLLCKTEWREFTPSQRNRQEGICGTEVIRYVLYSTKESPVNAPGSRINATILQQAGYGRAGLFLLSAAALVFEINLTRLFSVAQFYHFAFMIVSLALLGYGASGAFLAIAPRFGQAEPRRTLSGLALAAAASILGSYLLTNWLPFDSFSIAWDRRQALILGLHYLALATPFFFCGLATAVLLAVDPPHTGITYAANLAGSALGCILALAAPNLLGGEGTVALSSALAAVAALVARPRRFLTVLAFGGLLFACLPLMELKLSPYKGISYSLQYPGAEVIYQRWNSFSRIDMLRSPGVRSLPGLSYRYLHAPPAEDGLLVDGDDLSPIVLPGYQAEVFAWLPGAIAYELRPDARALVLEPRGGLDILTALELGAQSVIAVETNPLIVQAAATVYTRPSVHVVIDSDRSYLRRSHVSFDVIALSLTSAYHPIRSGAYSLAEDYRYTVEAFQDALMRLEEGGLLVVTRWLQNPPSEELRTFALAVSALERSGGDPHSQIVALRGYNTATLLIRNGAFTAEEMQTIRQFTSQRAFDLVYAPGLRPEETNHYNRLPEDTYTQSFKALVEAQPRENFYATYPYDVRPPTDDHPFFGHFFKWSQAGQMLAEMGKVWQPFGGAGYFVVLALLLLAILAAASVILLPMGILHFAHPATLPTAGGTLGPGGLSLIGYFGLIGLAYLLVEIPLMQRFILFLGHPAYALTTILFTLLSFSGLGSQMSACMPSKGLQPALGVLVMLLFIGPALLPSIFNLTLGLPLALRMGLTVLLLAPIGILMGLPFPLGIRQGIEKLPARTESSRLIAWAWASNGAASVVSSVLAALLALSFGFTWVLHLGALCYAGAWLIAMFRIRGEASPIQVTGTL
jgi:hypothetical protein